MRARGAIHLPITRPEILDPGRKRGTILHRCSNSVQYTTARVEPGRQPRANSAPGAERVRVRWGIPVRRPNSPPHPPAPPARVPPSPPEGRRGQRPARTTSGRPGLPTPIANAMGPPPPMAGPPTSARRTRWRGCSTSTASAPPRGDRFPLSQREAKTSTMGIASYGYAV